MPTEVWGGGRVVVGPSSSAADGRGEEGGEDTSEAGSGGGCGAPMARSGESHWGKVPSGPEKGEKQAADAGGGWSGGENGRRRRGGVGERKAAERKGAAQRRDEEWLGGTGRHHVPPPAQHRCCTVGTCTVQKHVLCNDVYCAVFNSRMFLHLT